MTDVTDTYRFYIDIKPLEDGLKVYAVQLTADYVHVVSETDAYQMAERIAAAIREHSNMRVEVRVRRKIV